MRGNSPWALDCELVERERGCSRAPVPEGGVLVHKRVQSLLRGKKERSQTVFSVGCPMALIEMSAVC